MIRMKVAASIAAAACVLLVAACGDDDGGDAATATVKPTAAADSSAPAAATTAPGSLVSVEVDDNRFVPANLTVPPGTKVTWDWTGKKPHSVVGTFGSTSVNSERMTGSGSFAFTFAEPGTFRYQCGVHGSGMAGTVTVR